jgi:hypothetical protein
MVLTRPGDAHGAHHAAAALAVLGRLPRLEALAGGGGGQGGGDGESELHLRGGRGVWLVLAELPRREVGS